MADTSYTISPPALRRLNRRRVESLPFGMIEVAPDGTILDFLPFKSQLSSLANDNLPERLRGGNFYDDVLPSEIRDEVHEALVNLLTRGDASERLLLVFPFQDHPVRLALVATARSDASALDESADDSTLAGSLPVSIPSADTQSRRISLIRLKGGSDQGNTFEPDTGRSDQSMFEDKAACR